MNVLRVEFDENLCLECKSFRVFRFTLATIIFLPTKGCVLSIEFTPHNSTPFFVFIRSVSVQTSCIVKNDEEDKKDE